MSKSGDAGLPSTKCGERLQSGVESARGRDPVARPVDQGGQADQGVRSPLALTSIRGKGVRSRAYWFWGRANEAGFDSRADQLS